MAGTLLATRASASSLSNEPKGHYSNLRSLSLSLYPYRLGRASRRSPAEHQWAGRKRAADGGTSPERALADAHPRSVPRGVPYRYQTERGVGNGGSGSCIGDCGGGGVVRRNSQRWMTLARGRGANSRKLPPTRPPLPGFGERPFPASSPPPATRFAGTPRRAHSSRGADCTFSPVSVNTHRAPGGPVSRAPAPASRRGRCDGLSRTPLC